MSRVLLKGVKRQLELTTQQLVVENVATQEEINLKKHNLWVFQTQMHYNKRKLQINNKY
jgi:hypothetical protein